MRLSTRVIVLALLTSGCHRGATTEDIVEGRRLYEAHGCIVCHGPQGRGDGPSASSLRVQPRDLRDAASFTQGSSIDEISETIALGVRRPESPMTAFAHIPAGERHQLAAYVRSLLTAITPLTARQAWVREQAPGRTTGGYVTLENSGGEDVVIVGGRSDAAAVVELHETTIDGSRMQLRQLSAVVVPARGRARLEPGGRHIMLIGLVRALSVSDHVVVTLVTKDGTEVPVTFVMRSRDAP